MKETLDVFKSIFSSANYFTHWFVLVTILVVLIFSILIFVLYKFKSKYLSMLISLALGFTLLILLFVIWNNTLLDDSIRDFTRDLLHLPGLIFINLVIIAVPFFLILVVAGLVFNSDFAKVKKSTYGVSFASLFGLSVLGVLIALMLSPLIMLIPNGIWPPEVDVNHTGSTSGGFAYGWAIVLGVIWFTFIISLILKITLKEKIEPLAKFTDAGTKVLTIYFKYLVMSIPYVLMLRIGSIGLTESPEDGVAFMFAYLGIFWLGALIISIILILLNVSLADKNLTTKEKLSIVGKQWLNVFAIQSTSAALPSTMEASQSLGVCKEITDITPKKGMFMGMVMCNGFTPMIIVLFAMIYEDMFTAWNVLLAVITILTLSFSTSGSGSADYVITMTALSATGIPNHLYFDHILWANEINEMTIAKPTNNLGHITATLITELHHVSKKECCEHGCNHDHSCDDGSCDHNQNKIEEKIS